MVSRLELVVCKIVMIHKLTSAASSAFDDLSSVAAILFTEAMFLYLRSLILLRVYVFSQRCDCD